MIKKIIAPENDSTLTSLGLLILRLWLGLGMFINHGCDKLAHFEYAGMFPDPLGVGVTPGLAFVTFAETVGAVLLALGLFTRFAATTLVVDLAIAVFMTHHRAGGAGELALVYLAGCIALLFAGGGKFSADFALFRRSRNLSPRPNFVAAPATDDQPVGTAGAYIRA